jgi:hypothetical protein
VTPGTAAAVAIAIVVMFAITCVFVLSDKRDEDRYWPGRADPFAEFTEDDNPGWAAELHHDPPGALPFPGVLEPLPVPPPAETGELPMIQCELGQSFDEYWDTLVATPAEAVA